MHAAGINATEWKLRKGLLDFGAGLPQTTGRDVAGVVDEVGEGVTDVAVGDRVCGVSDDGAGAAELALLTFGRRSRRPSVSSTPPASPSRSKRPRAAWTNSALALESACSSTAPQVGLAAPPFSSPSPAARVVGTASTANHGYLRLLGAAPVTYGEGMAERVRTLAPDGVDAALDVAGSDVLPELIDLVGGPQNVVTLADIDGAKQHAVRFSNGFQGHAFHALAEIGALIEDGRFGLPVEPTYPLDEISEAHRVSEYGHVRGRLVLVIG